MLGTLMSIGLKREKFGDIIAEDDAIQLMLAEEIADYVRMELTQIGRAKVSLKDLALNERLESQEQWQEK